MLRGQAKKHSVRAPLRCLLADETRQAAPLRPQTQPEFGKARTTKFKAAASDSLKIPCKQTKNKTKGNREIPNQNNTVSLKPLRLIKTVEPPIT
jgi:hypothetical protein